MEWETVACHAERVGSTHQGRDDSREPQRRGVLRRPGAGVQTFSLHQGMDVRHMPGTSTPCSSSTGHRPRRDGKTPAGRQLGRQREVPRPGIEPGTPGFSDTMTVGIDASPSVVGAAPRRFKRRRLATAMALVRRPEPNRIRVQIGVTGRPAPRPEIPSNSHPSKVGSWELRRHLRWCAGPGWIGAT